MLCASGVDWIGFPLRLPVHKEDVSEPEAAGIIGGLQAGVEGVLITYECDALSLRTLARRVGARVVQIHGEMSLHELKRLRCLAPQLQVIKSVVIGAPEWHNPCARIASYLPFVHGFITDTFDARSGARGATGRTHDWSVSREIVAACPKPVILAGGLTPDNVADAVAAVRPAGVDAHTGVEAKNGDKDPRRVVEFCRAAREAAQNIR